VRNQIGQRVITPHILVSGIRWDSGTDAQRYWGTSTALRHWLIPGSRRARPNPTIHAPESEDLPGIRSFTAPDCTFATQGEQTGYAQPFLWRGVPLRTRWW